MGGLATASVGTKRQSADDYYRITNAVLSNLRELFPNRRIQSVVAYAAKESFGDSDILIESNDLPSGWIDRVTERFGPTLILENGDVISFDFCEMQIDLILTQIESFEFAQMYFAFNDLGNLMGRIAHEMGFKFGHDGLWKILREGTHVFGVILVSRDVKTVMEFLGYSYDRFCSGFETLEDIFQFAASTPYFHRDIYQLHNRNYKSKVRDQKRSSYSGFLQWVSDKPELDRYVWNSYKEGHSNIKHDAQVAHWDRVAVGIFKGYYDKCQAAVVANNERKIVRSKWNGKLVSKWTSIVGKELGQFMLFCKVQKFPIPYNEYNFTEFIIDAPSSIIEQFVLQCKQLWSSK